MQGFAGISRDSTQGLHTCGKRVRIAARHASFHGFSTGGGLWTTGARRGPAILAPGRLSSAHSFFLATHETGPSAERTQAEAQARVPCSDVDPCGPDDPEAPSRKGSQAPLGVTPVQRRNRLSRSRDFDAVYRQGRSVSTRFLTLWWYEREEAVGDP